MLDRIDKLRKHLIDDKTSFLITSDVNRYYYSGFKSSAGAVLITPDSVNLLVDFRYYESATKCVDSDIDVFCCKKLSDTINEIILKEDIESIIIEDAYVTISQLLKLKNTLNAKIISDFSLSSKISELRMIKTDSEIKMIKTAQKIAEKSYLQLLNNIKVGVSEKRLALELEYLMKLNGAQSVAFDIISISGKNTSLPHGVPSDKELSAGDFITFDIGAVYNGYHSDMTRTIALSYTTDEMKEIYSIVLNAHNEATKKIFPNSSCSDVDKAARDYITEKGYGEYFGHSTGHGVGLEIHEAPTVYSTDNTLLKKGMVITNEPGIYLPDKFGVRIESMYLVTDSGSDELASIDKELLIL